MTVTETRPAWERVTPARRWGMLTASAIGAASSAAMVSGPAFLIPELHTGLGMSLAEAGLVASAPLAGMMLTLVAWGMVVDRRGERFALLGGLTSAALAGGLAILLAARVHGADAVAWIACALLLAGAASGATNSASGRVVVGWFPPERRGLAMGIRQTAQPLGVGLAGATMAVLADGPGIGAALAVPTLASLVGIVLIGLVVLDPPRPPAPEPGTVRSPYRLDGFLPRIHVASVLLVGPQFLVWTFGLTWLIDDVGWSAGLAGLVVLGTQLGGAAARIAAGWYSDHAGARMGPMRQIAWLAAICMLGLGVAAAGSGPWAVAAGVTLLVAASAVTVADNGLAFTAIAERAGPFWSGRALGFQNTVQYAMAAAVPPLAGLVITHAGYGWAFGLAALMPLAAIAIIPVAAEERIG